MKGRKEGPRGSRFRTRTCSTCPFFLGDFAYFSSVLRKEGRKEGSKEWRKEGRKEGRKEVKEGREEVKEGRK